MPQVSLLKPKLKFPFCTRHSLFIFHYGILKNKLRKKIRRAKTREQNKKAGLKLLKIIPWWRGIYPGRVVLAGMKIKNKIKKN